MYFNLLQILTSAQPILVMSMRRALTQTAPSSVLVVLVLMEMARSAKVRRTLTRDKNFFLLQFVCQISLHTFLSVRNVTKVTILVFL